VSSAVDITDHEIDSLYSCEICRVPFIPHHTGQHTCGSSRCREARQYRRERQCPDAIERERERLRARWNRRDGYKPNSALLGAPAYHTYLPGGALPITVRPSIPLDLRHTRHLHHAMTTALGRDHDPSRPDWSLMPWHGGWAVYLWRFEDAERLRLTARTVTLGHHRAEVSLGAVTRPRAPVVTRRGWHRVRLDAITPVVIRTMAGRITHTRPTASHLVSTLALLAGRLGARVETDRIAVSIEQWDTVPSTIEGTGKIGGDGRLRGWLGSLTLRCNAPARWLLESAARGPGLGGRVAFGFGRVRITEATE
jgi:hypothetical protein